MKGSRYMRQIDSQAIMEIFFPFPSETNSMPSIQRPHFFLPCIAAASVWDTFCTRFEVRGHESLLARSAPDRTNDRSLSPFWLSTLFRLPRAAASVRASSARAPTDRMRPDLNLTPAWLTEAHPRICPHKLK